MACYLKYKKELDATDTIPEIHHRLDTVGAVCVDHNHCLCAGTSSGGILLKLPGRVGQAAVYGSGCWAANPMTKGRKFPGVACSSTGVGELLIKATMAISCAKSVREK
jgi:taspase (threonine aspartase 1)